MTVTEDQVREALKAVVDPEIFVNIIDLGLVYVVDINPAGTGGDAGAAEESAPADAETAATAEASLPQTPTADAGSSPEGLAQNTEAAAGDSEAGAAAPTPAASDTNGEQYDVSVEMTLTSPACPAGPQLIQNVKDAVGRIEGVAGVEVKLVMTPPWTPDCMTDEARDQLGIF